MAELDVAKLINDKVLELVLLGKLIDWLEKENT